MREDARLLMAEEKDEAARLPTRYKVRWRRADKGSRVLCGRCQGSLWNLKRHFIRDKLQTLERHFYRNGGSN